MNEEIAKQADEKKKKDGRTDKQADWMEEYTNKSTIRRIDKWGDGWMDGRETDGRTSIDSVKRIVGRADGRTDS